MLNKFVGISLSCLFIILFISCKKDLVGDANTGGTAMYSFEGAPSGCAVPVVAGLYTVGTALTSANTITLSVNVTDTGTYSINTTTANGIWFSGIGSFSSIGSQTVVLTGNGIPIRMGSFAFVPATNNTCNFYVSFSAGGPPAIFTYTGAPNNCTAPLINGTYSSGINLGPGNYVDLAVNVSTPGAYTIITNNTNGVSFSGSGVFNTTGAQVVHLIGNGTPSSMGSFTYTPSNNGCSFSITVIPPAPPATFTYNGAPGNCTAPSINGTYAAGTSLNGTNTVVLNVNVSLIGSYSVSTNNSNGVIFSGSGNFAATGANTITLTSTNTPGTAGTFTYTPTGGCSFDITYSGAPPPPADFLTCKINGVVTNFNDNMFGASDQTASPYTLHVDGDLTGGTDNFAIDFLDNNNPIVAGNYNNFSLTNQNKNCTITYTTGAGFPWGSSLLNNNSFVVNLTSITATKATGTFSGTVYDQMGTGINTKAITAGSFSIGY